MLDLMISKVFSNLNHNSMTHSMRILPTQLCLSHLLFPTLLKCFNPSSSFTSVHLPHDLLLQLHVEFLDSLSSHHSPQKCGDNVPPAALPCATPQVTHLLYPQQSYCPMGWSFSSPILECGEQGEGGEEAAAGPRCSKAKQQEDISALIASRLWEDECLAGGSIISGH